MTPWIRTTTERYGVGMWSVKYFRRVVWGGCVCVFTCVCVYVWITAFRSVSVDAHVASCFTGCGQVLLTRLIHKSKCFKSKLYSRYKIIVNWFDLTSVDNKLYKCSHISAGFTLTLYLHSTLWVQFEVSIAHHKGKICRLMKKKKTFLQCKYQNMSVLLVLERPASVAFAS